MREESAQRGFAPIVITLIVLVGIVLAVYLTLHQQIFNPFASNNQTRIEFVDSNDNVITQTNTRSVKIRLTYVPPNQLSENSGLVKTAFAANCNPSGGIDPATWTLIEAYTCDPGNPGTAGQEWACFGSYGTPKAIKFSEDTADSVRCPVSKPVPTSTPVSACLQGCCGGANNMCGACPNGQLCRISNGACQSGLSCDPSTGATPAPSAAPLSGTSYGMQIDIRDPRKVPTSSQLQALSPQWVRFPFPCVNSAANGNSCPNDFHSNNFLSSLPSSVRKLAVITNDTTWNAPIGSSDVNTWDNYINNVYVPTIRTIVQNYGSSLAAIEIWNEEDLNDGPSYDPYVPPAAFAYMVSQSASAVKSLNPGIKVVVGGLASGNNTYIHQVYLANPNFAQNVDAIGVHPYQPPNTINQVSVVVNNLASEISADHLNKPVWVTEIGIEQYSNSSYPRNQAEFLGDVFNQFQAMNPTPQLVNWYAFSDLMGGVGGGINWGLVDSNGNIKESGNAFESFSKSVPSSTPTPPPYPTSFRVANSSGELSSALEQTFVQNGMEISWQLTEGNGQKTVYAQFKVLGQWQPPVSSNIDLEVPASPTPTPTSTPTATPTARPTSTPGACLPGCCGGNNNMCGSCPNGQICRISNGACTSGLSCDPSTGVQPTPTPTANPELCAECVIKARPDILPFYKSNGWDTSPSNYQNIVNNWCGIDPSSCQSVKNSSCSQVCGVK